MEDLKTRQLAFLEDTIIYYNSGNRGVRSNLDGAEMCSYTAGCAIGRHLDRELCSKFDCLTDSGVYNPYIFSRLPSNLVELGLDFLAEVQRLHDHKRYWNKKGLSEAGEAKVDEIKEQFKLYESI